MHKQVTSTKALTTLGGEPRRSVAGIVLTTVTPKNCDARGVGARGIADTDSSLWGDEDIVLDVRNDDHFVS